jgi:DnaJ-class molecular chaperone
MCRCPQSGYFCPKCRGKPTVRENVSLSLVVEKGNDEGSVVVFKNAGDTSEANAPGDLEVELISRPHPVFTRVGSDLHMNVSITLKEALVGFRRTVKNIDDTDLVVETTDPIGSDRTLRIRGKGLPVYLYPGDYGDIVVHATIRWPKAMTDQQRGNLADVLQMAE